MLFYTGDGNIYTTETFEKRNTWASIGAPERIEKTQEALKERVANIQKAYDLLLKAKELMDEAKCSYHNPFLYACEKEIGLKITEVNE
jgi:hypothetical protein